MGVHPGTRNLTPPPEAASALAWIAAASVPVTALEEAATIRLALDACARTIAGKPAAATTQRRKRAVFHNAASYAVELRLLGSHPIELIRWKAPAVAQTVDRRVVADPAQIRRLLTAVRGLSDRGKHLEAFYACLYYGYLRPSEAIMLKRGRLPAAYPRLGPHRPGRLRRPCRKDWTDDGIARQQRGLKHRAQRETRSIPIPPVLVRLLRARLKRYGTAPDGRIFFTVRGGLIQDSAYIAV